MIGGTELCTMTCSDLILRKFKFPFVSNLQHEMCFSGSLSEVSESRSLFSEMSSNDPSDVMPTLFQIDSFDFENGPWSTTPFPTYRRCLYAMLDIECIDSWTCHGKKLEDNESCPNCG